MTLAGRQRASRRAPAHRPWPPPARPWLQGQTWEHLLFAHWAVRPEALRRLLPPEIALDLFEGRAWLGVTPFEIRGLHALGLPPLPGLSRFPEVNVRTYVTVGDRPGIWFLSLDATNPLAVVAARRLYHLPYHRAAIRLTVDGTVHVHCRRADGRAELDVRYAPAGAASPPAAGTLEHWLTERYRLYTRDRRGRILHADIHHPPWPVQPAEAEVPRNTMPDPMGLAVDGPPLAHYARSQDVLIWPPERTQIGAQRGG